VTMKRYYNRIRPLQAEQWDGESHPLVVACWDNDPRNANEHTVITETGRTVIRRGDYIVTDTHLGEEYIAVCRRETFESLYREVGV